MRRLVRAIGTRLLLGAAGLILGISLLGVAAPAASAAVWAIAVFAAAGWDLARWLLETICGRRDPAHSRRVSGTVYLLLLLNLGLCFWLQSLQARWALPGPGQVLVAAAIAAVGSLLVTGVLLRVAVLVAPTRTGLR